MRTSLSILPLAVILLVQLAAEEFRVDGKTTKKPKPAAIPLRAKREETTTSPEPPPPSSTTEAMKQDEGVVDQEALLVFFKIFFLDKTFENLIEIRKKNEEFMENPSKNRGK
jgi:hypothetical protein